MQWIEVEKVKIVDDEAKIINDITSLFNDLGAAGFCLSMLTTYSRAEYAFSEPLSNFKVEESLQEHQILNSKSWKIKIGWLNALVNRICWF